jgi:DNA-directed RNA polymerase specialized sigma24 family protein
VIIYIHLRKTPVRQVAQALGRTEKAVASLLCRAMGKLRKNLVVNPS